MSIFYKETKFISYMRITTDEMIKENKPSNPEWTLLGRQLNTPVSETQPSGKEIPPLWPSPRKFQIAPYLRWLSSQSCAFHIWELKRFKLFLLCLDFPLPSMLKWTIQLSNKKMKSNQKQAKSVTSIYQEFSRISRIAIRDKK